MSDEDADSVAEELEPEHEEEDGRDGDVVLRGPASPVAENACGPLAHDQVDSKGASTPGGAMTTKIASVPIC